MASKAIKKYNVAVTENSGKVGNVRYVQKGGETYVRSAHNSKINNPRTDAQMRQRMLFASLGAFYREISALKLLDGAFKRKKANQTDGNAFMQINKNLGVFLTKDEIANGGCVALPAVISQGTLPAITITADGAHMNSSICTGTSVNVNSTIAAISAGIIANNPGYKYGDVLTYIQCVNHASTLTVFVEYEQLTLSASDTRTLQSACKLIGVSNGGYLKTEFGSSMAGTIGWIRTSGNQISSCTLTNRNETLINAYLDGTHWDDALESYGYEEKRVLYGSGTSTGGSSSAKKYKLTIYCSPLEKGTVTGAGSYAAGTVVTISATPVSGYLFSKWSDNNSTEATRTYTMPEGDSTITAMFKVASDGGAGQ